MSTNKEAQSFNHAQQGIEISLQSKVRDIYRDRAVNLVCLNAYIVLDTILTLDRERSTVRNKFSANTMMEAVEVKPVHRKSVSCYVFRVLFVLLLLFLVVIGVVWVYVVVPKYYKISNNTTTESQTEQTGTTGPSGWMNTYTNIGEYIICCVFVYVIFLTGGKVNTGPITWHKIDKFNTYNVL